MVNIMSCWHWTIVLRVPASALGFKYLREWKEFLKNHEDDFHWEEDCFDESLCEEYPDEFDWKADERRDPDWQLDQRDPDHPEIVPGPFLDFYIRDEYPLQPDDNNYGKYNEAVCLNEFDKKEYLPVFQELFPGFTMEDMDAVHMCEYEWYDGSDAPYLF